MDIKGSKIKQLIEHYGREKGYPEKSYLSKFTEDHSLNYKQWAAYTADNKPVGGKVMDVLMSIFPDLNLNWLLKDHPETFIGNPLSQLQEPVATYERADHIMKKLDEMHTDIKKLAEGQQLSQN